jgi:hypothetical protein
MRALAFWTGGRHRLGALAAALLLAGLAVVLSYGTTWAATWRQALDWGSVSTTLIGPVAAGAAAWLYATMRMARFDHLASTSVRPVTTLLQPAVELWALGAAAVLAVTAVTTVTAVAGGAEAQPGDLWVLVHPLSALATGVAVGAFLGFASGRVWTAPLAALGVFLLGFLSTSGALPPVFDTGGATSTLVGQVFDAGTVLQDAVACLGIAALGLLLTVRALAVGRRAGALALIAVVAAGAACYVHLGWTGEERYAYATHVTYRCAGADPQVCLAAETSRPLEPLAAALHTQADALREVDLPVPATFRQDVPGQPLDQDAGLLLLGPEALTSDDIEPAAIAYSLARPRPCAPFFSTAPPADALSAQYALAQWIGARNGVLEPPRGSPEAAWLDGAPDAVERWVRRTYTDLYDCDLTDLRPPVLP